MQFNLNKIISSISEFFDGRHKKGSRKILEENFEKLIEQTEILQSTVQRLTDRMESLEKISNKIYSQLSVLFKPEEEISPQSITGGRQNRCPQENRSTEEEKNENGHKRFKIEVKR